MIIDSSLVNVSKIIGQGLCIKSEPLFFQNLLPKQYQYYAGEFGVVYKGMLKKGAVNEVVAVKSLKGTC